VSTIRRPEKVPEWIARQIVHEIAAAGMTPGTVLPPESEMLARYGASRGSVREALRILEVKGLIHVKPGPGGGPVVADWSSAEFGRSATFFFHLQGATFRDLLEARMVVEPVMARLAAQRKSPQVDDLLRDNLQRARSVDAADKEAAMEVSGEFHKILSGSSKNPVLDIIGRSLTDIYNGRVKTLEPTTAVKDKNLNDHERIAEAVRAGDAEGAERLMHEHMLHLFTYLTKLYPELLGQVVTWE
jgi:GntR family transcriptional regulator, transcriptional repressor for pyruvate dehydrogenase complex